MNKLYYISRLNKNLYYLKKSKIKNDKVDRWMRLLQCFMITKNILATFDLISTSTNEVNHSDAILFLFLKLQKIIKNSSMSKTFSKNFNGLVVTCNLLRRLAGFVT